MPDHIARRVLHLLVWLVTYFVVTLIVDLAWFEMLGAFGVTGGIAVLLSNLIGFLTGIYWAHRIACDFVPVPDDLPTDKSLTERWQ